MGRNTTNVNELTQLLKALRQLTKVLELKSSLTTAKHMMKVSFVIQPLLNMREFTFGRISTNVQSIPRCLAVICHCISMKELVLQKCKECDKAIRCFSYFNYPQRLHTGEKLHIKIMSNSLIIFQISVNTKEFSKFHCK